jgi:hypothetical protein
MGKYEGTFEFRSGDSRVYRPIYSFMVDGGTQAAIYLDKSDDKAVKFGLDQAAELKNIIVILASGADASNALEGLRNRKTDAGVVFHFQHVAENGEAHSSPFVFKPQSSFIESVQVVNGAASVRISVSGAKVVPYKAAHHHGHHHGHQHGYGQYGYGQDKYGYGQYGGSGHHHHGHHHGHKN